MITNFAVKDMSQNLLSLVESKVQEKSLDVILRIENCISEAYHKVRSDEGRIKQAVFTLLVNVIRVATRGSTVHFDIYMKNRSEQDRQ